MTIAAATFFERALGSAIECVIEMPVLIATLPG
jgi:hypothetical protein